MNITNRLILFLVSGLLFVLTGSCTKETFHETVIEEEDYSYINQLYVSDGKLWVLSSIPSRWISFLPVYPKSQVSVTDLETGETISNNKIPAVIVMSREASVKPFLATYDRRILKLNDDLAYEEFFKIPQSCIVYEVVCRQEKELVVTTYTEGIYLFDGRDTLKFDSSNSVIETDNIPSIILDNEFNVLFMEGNFLYRVGMNRIISSVTDTLFLKHNHLPGENLSIEGKDL